MKIECGVDGRNEPKGNWRAKLTLPVTFSDRPGLACISLS